MSKNIEYVQSEVVGSEIVETATDSSKLGDLITEAWAQQYARSTGLKVVPQPAVQVETEVVELKALLLALLRAVWKTPTRLFGGSTLGAAVNNGLGWLRSRLLGDTTYGIPAYPNASVEEAKSILSRRRISGADVPDGMSLLNLYINNRALVTQLIDDNRGWVMSQKPFSLSVFPNVTKLSLGWKNFDVGYHRETAQFAVTGHANLQELELTAMSGTVQGGLLTGAANLTTLTFNGVFDWYTHTSSQYFINGTSLEELNIPMRNWSGSYDYHCRVIGNCSTLKRFIAPNLVLHPDSFLFTGCANVEYVYVPKTVRIDMIAYNGGYLKNLARLRTFIAGGLQHVAYSGNTNTSTFNNCPQLIHLEVVGSITASTQIPNWSPTMALRTDTDAEDYVDLREDKDEHGEFIYANNLEQFLANFSAYIIDRLAQRTASTTLTLTLSQAVRNVLTAEQEQAIANKYWNLSPANKTT